MKPTSKILVGLGLLFATGLFASNMLLKKEYDKLDKSDKYWTYQNILDQPFRHIHIDGGNLTRIVFTPSPNYSVRVAKDWLGNAKDGLKVSVKNDTLYLTIPNTYKDIYEKNYLRWSTVLRIFAPTLQSITGNNTNFLLAKSVNPDLTVMLRGKSELEVESLVPEFGRIEINQRDSSNIQFEMDPSLKVPGNFHVRQLTARIAGTSFLNIGQARIDSLQLSVDDSSGIFLSGSALRK